MFIAKYFDLGEDNSFSLIPHGNVTFNWVHVAANRLITIVIA
jgi:multidrug resistance efflux pump